MEEIAEEALVSVRTVQRYFGSKADIVFADHDENIALFRSTLAKEFGQGATLSGAIVGAALAAARASRENGLAVERQPLLDEEPVLRARWLQGSLEFREALAEAIATQTGRQPEDPSVVLTAGAIQGALRACWGVTLRDRADGGPDADPTAIFKRFSNFVDCGLKELLGGELSADSLK
jgi:AcrR family transcriptional regulator